MKKAIKILLGIIGFGLFIILITIFLSNVVIKSNISKNEIKVSESWHELFNVTTERYSFLRKNIPQKNDIYRQIINNEIKRAEFADYNSESYIQMEYLLNENLVNYFDTISNLTQEIEDFGLKNICYNNELNKLIDKYNNSVKAHNIYISRFPNFIIAKRNNFNKKKYFAIKYGIRNDDPEMVRKEKPKWAENVDDNI